MAHPSRHRTGRAGRWLIMAAAVGLLAACTTPSLRLASGPVNNDQTPWDRYPYTVEKRDVSIALPGALGSEALSDKELVKLDGFIAEYRRSGRGALRIAVPRAENGDTRALDRGARIADHAQWRGVPPVDVELVVETAASQPDEQIVVSYAAYSVRMSRCGDWSKENSHDFSNTEFSNFSCSIRHNVAVMLADPGDITAPHAQGLHDTTRSNLVIQLYRAGKATGAERAQAETAAISNVSK